MTRRPKPYDPVAYQAELDAKCGRAGSAWASQRRSHVARMPEDQRQQHDEARREMARLELPIGEEWDSSTERSR